ncbi:MAG TPA: IMP cyclohydrolase [Candidatus Hydrogenedentes bacterium]|nr:IMP cyclohydrolase [Candidatus Hydrogenedentota bacterium]HOS03567.1 IMP cyclohydrolase [Candidatus Hydrogenedentota bacterium]
MPNDIYVGRLVVVGRTEDGRWAAGYRVSSRSFPNRMAVANDAGTAVRIVPKPGFELDVQKNPYIAYNCVRVVCGGSVIVVSNGSQTDPIAEKIDAGMGVRDALALSMMALDYEKDQLDTPRITAVADTRGDGAGWLAVVRKDGIEVRQALGGASAANGTCHYVSTYERNTIDKDQNDAFGVKNAADVCAGLFQSGVFKTMTNGVTAVGAVQAASGFELAIQDAIA